MNKLQEKQIFNKALTKFGDESSIIVYENNGALWCHLRLYNNESLGIINIKANTILFELNEIPNIDNYQIKTGSISISHYEVVNDKYLIAWNSGFRKLLTLEDIVVGGSSLYGFFRIA